MPNSQSRSLLASAEVQKPTSSSYNRQYWKFVTVAGVICVVRVCSNAVSLYNTAVLGSCGGIGQSVQYLATGLFSLFFSKPLVDVLGCKVSFITCATMYIIYIACFLCAILYPDYMWEFNIPGSTLNGIAESIWLIAQGVFYSSTVERVVASDPSLDGNTVRSHLAAVHCSVYMGADTSLLIIATLAIHSIGNVHTFFGVLILCLTAGLTLLCFGDLDDGGSGDVNIRHLVKDVGKTFELFTTDSRLGLLTPFLLAYGSTNALVGTYITGVTITNSPALGECYVGSLSALSRLAGTACGPLYDVITVTYSDGRHWVMLWGCVVYLSCGVLVVALSPETLGVPVVAITYQLLWGAGRGVMENTCRLILAEFFVKNVSSAFSYYAFAVSLWTGISFYFDDYVNYSTMGWGVFGLAIVAAWSYRSAYTQIKRSGSRSYECI